MGASKEIAIGEQNYLRGLKTRSREELESECLRLLRENRGLTAETCRLSSQIRLACETPESRRKIEVAKLTVPR